MRVCLRRRLAVVLASGILGLGVAAAAAARAPNILLILADDLGYGDIACYNPESRIPTPRIDGLAAQGMRFTDAHSPCTVCTPTRYSLMTGQMAFRIPHGGRVFTGAGGPSLIAPGRLTLPEMLQARGYATAAFGKWHVGWTFYDTDGRPIHQGGLDAVRRIDYRRRLDGGPVDHGFDHFFGTACCPTTDWLYAFIVDDRIPVAPTHVLDRGPLPKHAYSHDNRAGMIAPDFNLEEVDLLFLAKSRAFIETHVRQHPDTPFFVYHALQAVHLPSFPATPFKGRSGSGPHGDFIVEMDWIVGALLATVERLGVADNTIVIFTSDNGPEVPTVYAMRHDHGHDGARPWRGMKRDNWEGGHRVPFIVRWPGHVRPGTTSDQITSLTDVMATLAEILGVTLPHDAAEDSVSMLPAWRGRDAGPIRDYLLQQGFGGTRWLAIRRGHWKYLDHKGSGGNRYETHRQLKEYYLPDTEPNTPGQLYDLNTDPGERTNVSLEHPDVVRQLKALLEASKAGGRSRP